MTPDAIEQDFIREFSCASNQIGKSQHKADRRERVRQAIYVNGKMSHKFYGTTLTYAEAFQRCFGERLDRRAAARALPDDDEEEPDV